MKAIIMAGGEGQRLRPLTCNVPKPMVTLLNRPVMAYAVELLRAHGIKEMGATVQYLGERIERCFQQGAGYDCTMHYFWEDEPLGTAGSVKAAGDFLDETFFVLSGDALTDADLSDALRFHRQKGSKATLLLKRVPRPLEYGVVITDDQGRVTRFLEKPSWGQVFSDTVNTGIYILEPEVLSHIPEGPYDFGKQLFPALLKANVPMYGYVMDGYWCDVGDIHTYLQAHWDGLNGRIAMDWGQGAANGLVVAPSALIETGAQIEGPCLIGGDTVIKAGAHIGPFSVIGRGCRIDGGASIKRSVLWDEVRVGERAQVRGAVLCNRAIVEKDTSVFEGAAVAEGARLGRRSLVMPGVRIWPHKQIQEGLSVERNVVWGKKEPLQFSESGIKQVGDWTPEQAAQLGGALVQALKWKEVILGGDDSNAGRMLRAALSAGLTACGAHVRDAEDCAPQVLRYAISALGLSGGVMIHHHEGFMVDIFDHTGSALGQGSRRALESACLHAESPRVPVERIGTLTRIQDVQLFYCRELLAMVDAERIRKAAPECGIVFENTPAMELMRSVLQEVGCHVVLYRSSGAGKAMKPGAGVTFFIPYNGEELGVAVDGQWLNASSLPVLLAYVAQTRMPRSEFHVTPMASLHLETLANTTGCRVDRLHAARTERMSALMGGDISHQLWARLSFDAVASALLLIDAAVRTGYTLEEYVRRVPRAHIREVRLPCRTEDKGRIIRKLAQGINTQAAEGVREVGSRGWSWILPDSDAAECRIICEGLNAEFADELATLAVSHVREAQKATE